MIPLQISQAGSSSGGAGTVFIVVLIFVASAVVYYLYRKNQLGKAAEADRLKREQERQQRADALSRLAHSCWDAYQQMLRAKGRAYACMNLLTADGAISSIAQTMADEQSRYAADPGKLALVTREADAPRIQNYAIAHKFLSGGAWAIPAPAAAGFTTREAYLAHLGFQPADACDSYDAWRRKLEDTLQQLQQQTRHYDAAPEIDAARRILPLLAAFVELCASDATDAQLLSHSKDFTNKINDIIHAYR